MKMAISKLLKLPILKDFNTVVENSVEKRHTIFVSDSAVVGSAFCTAARAGTFVSPRQLETNFDSILVGAR
jgi:hypothetical protein